MECQPPDFPDAEDSGGNRTPRFLFLVELVGRVTAQLVKCLHEQEYLHLIPQDPRNAWHDNGVCFLSQHGPETGGSVRLAGWPARLT